MSVGKRSFARELNEQTAAQIRNQVSAAFSTEFSDGPVASSLVGEGSVFMSSIAPAVPAVRGHAVIHPVASQVSMDVADPIDYEKFIAENSKMLEDDPHKEMLAFPEDDVTVTTLPRKFRTLEIPVPGPAKRTDDPLVRDCVRSFTQEWSVVNRKFGGFHGQDEQFLSRRFSTCKRTVEYAKQLPKHEYEVDMPADMSIPEEEKKRYRQSISSNVDYNLDQAESDTLLLDLLEVHDDIEVDKENMKSRSANRHPSLFGLYPLPGREEAKENRTPAPPPAESQGLKLLVKVSELRFDLNIEPIFAVMALYDAKEKKKISESFHLDCNPSDITHMLDDHVEERSMASLSRSAIFNISYPSADVFLIIKIEKVLQQGDISEAVEPYLKARDLDKKTLEKYKVNANYFCQQLGQYRMPFAWTAINVLDIIAGNQSTSGSASTGSGQESRESTLEKRKSDINPDKRGGTPEPGKRRDTRSSSISSTSRSMSDEGQGGEGVTMRERKDSIANITQNFRPVTLTVNVFFKQESDKLSDEDLFRHLMEMRKSSALLSRKFKSIPGNLKVDISAPYENMPCCLTSNLWEIDPFPDNRNRRPTREVEEFSPREVYTPYTTYKNMLYIYPQSLDFRSGKGRNIGIKIQFMAGEDREDALPCIYGKSCSPSFLREAWCPILYHNRQPEFYEEIKVELPAKITEKHHLLFTFYQISCQKPRPGEPLIQEPTYLGCTWIPMLQHSKMQLGDFNLCVTADHPPPAYSQISSDTPLPNLKWIDGHKPVFKVTVSMVSSIHPQDPHIEEFTNRYYELHNVLGSEQQEKGLAHSMTKLQEADPERVVQFLHILLNNLCSLLVRPCVTGESADIPPKAFEAIVRLVNTLHILPLPADKHLRNTTLSSYIQYIFNTPLGQHPAHAFNKTATISKARSSSSTEEDAYAQSIEKGGSMRTTGGRKRVGFSSMSDSDEGEMPGRKGSASSLQKVFHEELVLQWIVSHPNLRVLVLGNAWFFFELLVKSMAQFLGRKNLLNAPRKNRFSVKFMKDLESLISVIATEIAEKHIKNGQYARRLNVSLAFFIHDCFSLMDRGFVFSLIKCYLKKFQLSVKDYNLTEFRLDFYRIVCSHEHLVTLNLPLGTALYPLGPGSQHSSPSSSISSTLENLDMPNVEAMGELSTEFRTYHYLSGLVLAELALVPDGKSPKLREQAIEVVRDLLASHDSDSRYNKPTARARIASLYLPLLSIIMDLYPHLYKGADGWEDWSTTFERNATVRRSVVIKEGVDGSLDIEGMEPGEAQTPELLLGPVSTRNLLICFLWVLKNIDGDLLAHWWATLSITKLNTLMNVLDLAVACFEYRPGSSSGPSDTSSLQGKRNLQHQTSTGSTTSTTGGNRMRSQLANAILGGEGTARDMLARRKRGTFGQSEALRWGKTYWQATSEQAERPKVDVEVDAQIEGSLAAEASMIVLDTLELLVQTISTVDNLRSTLGRSLEVLLHLMGTNQSLEVMKNIFSTQRSIVWKFPELLFFEETEQCAELCTRLLRHCSSGVKNIRTWACASLYLLMRHNFDIGNTFARVKVQVTVALSSIVAGNTTFNEHHLRRSLKTLMSYADNDREMEDSTFPEQVRDLSINLHHILLDTVKMQEFQDDPEMLMDLMYRISKGYQNSPDLRLTWLEAMAEKNTQVKNYTEAAMCLVHAAALVSEYLYMLEGKPYVPKGCVVFQKISQNVLEESAISDDILAPEEEGICTSKLFSEHGLIGLMEQAATLFREAQLFEAMNEVYQLIVPIYEAKNAYQSLEKVHKNLADCYQQLLQRGSHRFLGTYFRVGFYGLLFGDLDRQEFIYKEAALTRLGEFSLRLQKLYGEKLGADKVELLKESKDIDPSTLDPVKGFIQVTFVEPYFEDWELKERPTIFDRSFNIRRFVFNTPYTKGGKAHGDLSEQCMCRTILTAQDTFPYVKKRSKVIQAEKLDLSPLEVAILGMQDKIFALRKCLTQTPTDTKLLQMLLQGGIATAVNQGPFAIAKCFLDIPIHSYTHDHRRLRVCFKEFTRRCQEALDLNKHLITEEQYEYHQELHRNFKDFQNKLEPMVPTKKKHKRSRDRALKNIATTRTSKLFSTGD